MSTPLNQDHNTPFVSVLVLNFDGRKILPDCLRSIYEMNYPSDKFEVVVIDNCSVDESADKALELFPQIQLIRNNANLGFAEGNNVFLRQANNSLVALVNNDARPEKNWLKELVETYRELQDEKIGAIASKIVFDVDVIPLYMAFESIAKDADLYRVSRINSLTVNGVDYLEKIPENYGVLNVEIDGSQPFRWVGEKALIPLSVKEEQLKEEFDVVITLHSEHNQQISVGSDPRYATRMSLASGINTISLTVKGSEIRKVLNSTGSLLLSNGSGADRGFKEIDFGQYSTIEEVFGFCGASVLLNREMLNEVGIFAPRFFMYYEDTDLSWRMRSQGWKIYYCPKAVMIHRHAFSSTEGSPFFTFFVERNRLFMLLRNASASLAMLETSKYMFKRCIAIIKLLPAVLMHKHKWLEQELARQRALQSLILNLPRLLRERIRLLRPRINHQVETDWLQPVSWWRQRTSTNETLNLLGVSDAIEN